MKQYIVIVDDGGNKFWYLNGLRHREDGPAMEWANGNKSWWRNGDLHREDGPAVEFPNGDKEWWLNNKLHREDGPARERSNGTKEWYLDGWRYNKKDFDRRMKAKTTCDGREIVIDGKKYKLQLVD
jgi:hypothetical protein